MKRKIIVYSEIFPPKAGGSGRFLYELYRRNDQIIPFFYAAESPGAEEFDRKHPHLLVQRYVAQPTSWSLSSWQSLKDFWRHAIALRQLVKKQQASTIHCCRILPEGMSALWQRLLLGVPYSCFIHGEDIEVARSSRELTLLTKLVMRFAEHLICNSHNTKGYVEKYWSAYQHKAVVIHPGVDTDYFMPGSNVLPFSSKQPLTLLTVGRLQLRKGHDMVIRAIAMLKEQGVLLHYRIAGDGSERQRLEALVKQFNLHEQVYFLAEISDAELLKEYQNCDLLILANRRVGNDDEGFGMVLTEAQACGKAVIAGNSGGTREALAPDVSGWIVDCDGPDELASLLALLNQFPEHITAKAENSRNFVIENYSWPTIVRKFIASKL